MADKKTTDEDLLPEADISGTEVIRVSAYDGSIWQSFRVVATTLLLKLLKLFTDYADVAGLVLTPDGAGGFKWAPTAGTTYTPTLNNEINLTNIIPNKCQYIRIGSVVTVFGSFAADITAAGTTTVDISLPIASDLSIAIDLNGTASATPTVGSNGIVVGEYVSNNVATLTIEAAGTVTGRIFFSFAYEII